MKKHIIEKKTDKDIHFEAMERFDDAFAFDEYQRYKCKEDIKFVLTDGGQWDDYATKQRKNRPMLTIDKVTPAINQIIGEHRQNRVSIKVRPSINGTTEIAETFNGLIRNITSISKAQHAYDIAFRNIAVGGFGAWRIVTHNIDDESFDQNIAIKPIINPENNVWIDPDSIDPNGRDAKYMFVIKNMSKDKFEYKYPDSIASDFNKQLTTIGGNTCHSGWSSKDSVRVAEYWVKKMTTKTIVGLSDGRIISEDKFNQIGDELSLSGVTEIKRRIVRDVPKIIFYRLSGSEILEGPIDFAGKNIPIVLVYGYNGWLDNVHYYSGIVRKAKDPQRAYNYTASQILEASALAPKDPWLITPKMMAGHKEQWSRTNIENKPYLLYNTDSSAPGASPVRLGAPSLQQALIQQQQTFEADIRATTGLFAPSLGDVTGDQSGKAILAVQRQGDRGTTELFDNLTKAIEYSGEILLDMIPRIYDAERQVRILKEDGDTEMKTINQTIIDQQTGQEVIINDLSQGKYDLSASSGPTFASQRSETVNVLSKLAATNPNIAPFITDLITKNLDFSFADDLTERIRKSQLGLPPITPSEKEQQMITQLQQQQQQQAEKDQVLNSKLLEVQLTSADLVNEELAAKIDGIEIDNEAKRVNIEKTRATISKTLADSNIAKIKVGAPVTPSDIEAMLTNTELLNAGLDISEVLISEEAHKLNPTGIKPDLVDLESQMEMNTKHQSVDNNQQPDPNMMVTNQQDQQHKPDKPQTTSVVKDPKTGLLVNIDTKEIIHPTTGEILDKGTVNAKFIKT